MWFGDHIRMPREHLSLEDFMGSSNREEAVEEPDNL